MEAYYYNHLNKQQQTIYHDLLKGLQALAPEILLPRCEAEALFNIFFQLRLDHPAIFWAVNFS